MRASSCRLPLEVAASDSPEVHNSQKVGTVFNAHMDRNNKLVAEAWIDVESVARFPEVEDAIRRSRPMEISTGLTHRLNDRQGTFNGKTYHMVVENLTPDHLALLPDRKGACGIDDGCGLNRNEESNKPVWIPPPDELKLPEPLLRPAMNYEGGRREPDRGTRDTTGAGTPTPLVRPRWEDY